MDDRNRNQQGEGMEDRQKQGGNVQNPGEKKPTQGDQGQGMEDRNRGQNQGQDQGQGGERKSA